MQSFLPSISRLFKFSVKPRRAHYCFQHFQLIHDVFVPRIVLRYEGVFDLEFGDEGAGGFEFDGGDLVV